MDDLQFLHEGLQPRPKESAWANDQALKNQSGAMGPIFVVEDDPILARSIQRYLNYRFEQKAQLFSNGDACLNAILEADLHHPFCLITDVSLEKGPDGLSLVELLKKRHYCFFSVAITGFASIENAIEATKKGVDRYLTKPFELEKLFELIRSGMQQKFFRFNDSSEADLGPQLHSQDLFMGMVGRSKEMKDIFLSLQKIAPSNSTVLISGESGTGKELVARAIHDLVGKKDSSFISVNCGAIPSELLESELFGHVRGAFTGAVSDRRGRFELAENGTLFLDEIGDMPMHLQVKLLRVIQEREYFPVGSERPKKAHVRIVTATHRDLEKRVQEGLFRQDLYYRLNVIPIRIPSLRERKDDIAPLIQHFLQKFTSGDERNKIELGAESLKTMYQYSWPGNIRELENVLERLVILRAGTTISPEDLPYKIYSGEYLGETKRVHELVKLPPGGVNLKNLLEELEYSLIEQALERTKKNKNQAAKILSMNRTTLIEKLKKYERKEKR